MRETLVESVVVEPDEDRVVCQAYGEEGFIAVNVTREAAVELRDSLNEFLGAS